MPIAVLMPSLSPTMTEGKLVKWLVKAGDKINAGDLIAEVETDKAIMEVESSDSGIVGSLLEKEDTVVAVGNLIAVILKKGESNDLIDGFVAEFGFGNTVASAIVDGVDSLNRNVEDAQSGKEALSVDSAKLSVAGIDSNVSRNLINGDRVFASPLAKKVAQQNNVDISAIVGSGPKGRVVKRDIEDFVQHDSATSRQIVDYDIIPVNGMRATIARRLLESKQTIPHFYLNVQCDVTEILQERENINVIGLKDSAGQAVKITVNDIFIKAIAIAIANFPSINKIWAKNSQGQDAIAYFKNVDIAVAVSTTSGLFTPVLKSVDKMGLLDIRKSVVDFVEKAKNNKLKVDEMQGGCCSVSNLGMFGIESFNAIINPPQSFIISIGCASVVPAFDASGGIYKKSVVNVGMSVDHRVIDGAEAAEFLRKLKDILLNPIFLSV